MTQPSNDDVADPPIDSWDDDAPSVTPDRLKVLIVEDDELMHRLLRRALTDFGFTQIRVAENGADGLAAAEHETPDIIISDYKMPGMHGLELIDAIRANDALDQTAIIMMSAADDKEVIESARDLGADTFMVKPFERADLKQLIGTLYHRFNCARISWPE
jgi:CheY-like chemotaxis protein